MSKLAGAVIAALCAVLAFASPAQAAPQDTTIGVGPPLDNWTAAFLTSMFMPDAAPIGANDWSCVPSPEHPRPVVLVHGTWENALSTWSGLAPTLQSDGYCVYALNFGRSNLLEQGGVNSILPGAYGARPIESSAQELAPFVDAVLAQTGASQVDLVGHSQGGLVVRQYLRFEGGAPKTANVVTLAATNHGTTMLGMGTLDRIIRDQAGVDLDPLLNHIAGVSGIQQVYDSPFLRTLNAGGDTEPGIAYTAIATRYDEVSTPFDWTFLTAGPGATVRNVTIQDGCEIDFSEHLSIDYSPRAIDWVRHALDPVALPLDRIRCTVSAPLFGNSNLR